MEFAEHLHVSLELEFRSLDDHTLFLGDVRSFKGHAHFGILLLDFLTLVFVFHILLDGELVVLGLKLNPLASLFCDGHDRLLVLHLSFTEDFYVFGLVLFTESLKLSFIEDGSLWCKQSAALTGDDCAEHDEILVFKSAVNFGMEVTMGIHSFAHGELWIIIFWFGVGLLLASP